MQLNLCGFPTGDMRSNMSDLLNSCIHGQNLSFAKEKTELGNVSFCLTKCNVDINLPFTFSVTTLAVPYAFRSHLLLLK